MWNILETVKGIIWLAQRFNVIKIIFLLIVNSNIQLTLLQNSRNKLLFILFS